MDKENWEVVDEVNGELQAKILGGLLEAQGIQVLLLQEGAGRVYGLSLGELGRVRLMVPAHQAQDARKLLEQYYAGEFEEVELDPQAIEDMEATEENEEDPKDQ